MIRNTNVKDIFVRNAIAGALDYLNRNVKITQTVNDQDTEYDVKFYYNFGQDEQFMKDFFVNLPHGCVIPDHAEGNFEMRPLGVLKFASMSVRTSDMTNKFVRGTYISEGYTDNMKKTLAAYSAYLMRIPLTIKINVDMQADNLGQAMRLIESVLANVYKSNTLYFQYHGLRVPAEMLIGDSVDLDKKVEFTYDDNQVAHAKFDFDINTTFPVFDKPSEVSRSMVIREFMSSLNRGSADDPDNLYVENLVNTYVPPRA